MKLLLCLIFLLPLAACERGASTNEFNGDSAFSYLAQQVAFGPRVPNTGGHRQAGDWIGRQLDQRADTVVVQEFDHVTVKGDTLRLRNFIGRFRPDLTDRILYVAHWDTRPTADLEQNVGAQQQPIPGANDGASGVALLLGVADALKRVPPSFGVDLLMVDGEDYGDWDVKKDVLLGSRYYAQHQLPGPKPLFAVVWDMVADKDLEIWQEGHSVANAPEVVQRVWSVAEQIGVGGYFHPSIRHTVGDDHIPLLEAGIRAIDVIDFDYPYWHTLQDTLDKVSAESLDVVGEVAVALTR